MEVWKKLFVGVFFWTQCISVWYCWLVHCRYKRSYLHPLGTT